MTWTCLKPTSCQGSPAQGSNGLPHNSLSSGEESKEPEEDAEDMEQLAFFPGAGPSQAVTLDNDEDNRVMIVNKDAAREYGEGETMQEAWRKHFTCGRSKDGVGGSEVPDDKVEPHLWDPFESEMDWEVGSWCIKEGFQQRLGLLYHNMPSLLQKVDSMLDRAPWMEQWIMFKDRPGEKHLVQYRDIIMAIKALLGNLVHAGKIVYRLSRTSKWWHAVQSILPKGATVAPIIISTDKTQLTRFSGNRLVYPVYMMLGNIPKALQRKPSEHACMLISYLSVDKVDGTGITDKKQCALVQQLFHTSVKMILEPLEKAGKEGVDVTCGDGKVHKVFPILAVYVADYPEQTLVSCSKYGTCPICQCPETLLEEAEAQLPRTSIWTLDVLKKACTKGPKDPMVFYNECKEYNVSGYAVEPFWKGHTLTDIHSCITPDILHQLYQGVFKHVLEWCGDLMDEEELDRRIRTLPPALSTRHFKNRISSLSQVSGSERKDMARILLGCLVGCIPNDFMLTFRAILDFIYLAQYPAHDNTTLKYMMDALKLFHKHKDILKELGIREHMNIPKFHSLLHYIDSIKNLGTTDNYNTEMFERLHIDCVKKAWRTSVLKW
ncbi:hypothetical protein FOMPIDRAFT_1055780 [Fomitopsis schrenkii]|uniref:CxC2-like cysteine cluster KDZ transposase-associated domain-containing protein n=1 Tax=Fomitopsis schrenkii TaxID=2126942 RepID=S8DLV7_FOMSC|nr:hypothetical protein FOMPIDRAFT_1055780 [Fomitopsis schrenkii]